MTAAASRIPVIIPAHNRRELTLGCLRHLQATGVLSWAEPVVVDDGSTDGTGAAVGAEFPGATVLRGDGRLWWTGAILLGMKHALATGTPDAVFWLNDDCRPDAGALEQLHREAVAGSCIALVQVSGAHGVRHGGLHKRWHGLEAAACPPDRIVNVATMNGNCVCVPATVIERSGLPDAVRFPQAWGDTDYGLRCHRLHIGIKVIGPALCTDADPANPDDASWLRGPRSVRELARSFGSPKNYFHPGPWWRFNVRHWGPWGAVLFAAPYLRFVLIAVARAVLPANLRRGLNTRR